MRIQSRFELLPTVRCEVIAWARGVGVSDEAAQDLALCVHEAVMNAIEHGNRMEAEREVEIGMSDLGDWVAVTVRDERLGSAAKPGAGRDETPPPTSGRGLPTIFALMDAVTIDRGRGEITLRLFKNRRGRG